jgi:hypothetical protein
MTEYLEVGGERIEFKRAVAFAARYLARLCGILDDYKANPVSLTKLSKILHRKRPELIPLYDENIRVCYTRIGMIPHAKDRSWEDFSKLLLPAIQHDLVRQMDKWREIAALAPNPAISPLRALDIIRWHLGGQSRRMNQLIR